MNQTIFLELDFYRTSYRSVKAHQYDKDTRFIEVTCIKDAIPYPLDPATMTCNLKLQTPDGRHMFKTETIKPNGKIFIALEESMLLAAGICKAELNVYDIDSKKLLSTMPFDLIVIGSVYDNSIIEDSDEFSVLNDMIFYNKELGDRLEQLEADVTEAESERNENEETRKDNEINRQQNEIERQSNEITRQTNESVREASEDIRIENENFRKGNEDDRQGNEVIRQNNESIRESNETVRQNNELIRQSNESTREAEEEIRNANEDVRKNNEVTRQECETIRQTNESVRETGEDTRNTNEETRKNNEIDRQNAEKDRNNTFEQLQDTIDTKLANIEKVNIEPVSEANSYQIKVTDRNGNITTSPNLLHRLQIGTVETGDSDEEPTASITGDFGEQKLNLRLPTGKPFKIHKTYPSISEMNADVDNIELYEFVLIHTGSVEDEDTGKLYMKDISGMLFLTDLSGVQGIQGETGATPNLSIGSVTTGEPGTEASVQISGTKENPLLHLTIPRGAPGTIEDLSPEDIGALPLTGGELTGTLVPSGGIDHVGRDRYISYPEDGYFEKQHTVTGGLIIVLPISWISTMVKFTVSIFNYCTNESTEYLISGHTWDNLWYNCTAVCVGNAAGTLSNLPVRFIIKEEKPVVIIGESTTSWDYPIVKICNILVGFGNVEYSHWRKGWNISIGDISSYTARVTIANTHVGYGSIASDPWDIPASIGVHQDSIHIAIA